MHCQLVTHLHRIAVRLSWIHAASTDCSNTFNRVNQALRRKLIIECQIQKCFSKLYINQVASNTHIYNYKIVVLMI